MRVPINADNKIERKQPKYTNYYFFFTFIYY